MKRIKITTKEPLTSEEIKGQMNFDQFIAGHTPVNPILSAKTWFIGGLSLATVAAITIAVMNSSKGEGPKKFSEDTVRSFIAPPIPKMNIAENTLIISGNSDTTISYPSGTKVFIPANSFVDKYNKPVTGPFAIHFREFRDQYDQLFSGIPMTYDSAGVTYQFESAGMFEIGGTKNGENIFIANGKELAIDIPSTDLNNKFNFYYLDTVAKNWSYDNDNSLNSRLITAGIDSILHQNYHTSVKDIVIPKEADPNLDNLVIDFNKDEFPELAMFKGVKFEFVDRNSKANNGANYVWEDVSVSRKEKGHYMIEFTKGDTKKSFVTVPVMEKTELEKMLAEYDHIRVKRMNKLKAMSDSINSLKSKYEAEHHASKDHNEAISNLVSKGKFLTALNEYVDIASAKILSRQGTITRMAMVRRFGIYNFDCAPFARVLAVWDRLQKPKQEPKTASAHYYFGKKRIESEIETAYIIKRDFNGIFKLAWKEIFDFPAQTASGADILIVVTKDKQFYYIKDEEFKKLNFEAKDIAFNLKGAPSYIRTPGEMKEFFED